MSSEDVLVHCHRLFQKHDATMETVADQLRSAAHAVAASQERILRSTDVMKRQPFGPIRSARDKAL